MKRLALIAILTLLFLILVGCNIGGNTYTPAPHEQISFLVVVDSDTAHRISNVSKYTKHDNKIVICGQKDLESNCHTYNFEDIAFARITINFREVFD